MDRRKTPQEKPTLKPDRRTAWAAKDRAAKRAKGLVRRDVWCYPADWPEIQALAEKLTERRQQSKGARNDRA